MEGEDRGRLGGHGRAGGREANIRELRNRGTRREGSGSGGERTGKDRRIHAGGTVKSLGGEGG